MMDKRVGGRGGSFKIFPTKAQGGGRRRCKDEDGTTLSQSTGRAQLWSSKVMKKNIEEENLSASLHERSARVR